MTLTAWTATHPSGTYDEGADGRSRRSCWRTRAGSTPRSSFPGSRRTTAAPRSSPTAATWARATTWRPCARRPSPPAPRECVVEDLREEFVRDYAFKALAAGAVYEDNYLLGTALARPLLAYGQVQVRAARGRRRAGPRRHRQGQRPGPLRGDLRDLRAAPAGDRALARVEHPLARGRARRTRPPTTCPSTRRRATSSAATATSGTSPTRAATSRTPGTRRARRCSSSPSTPQDAPDKPRGGHDRLRARRARVRSTASGWARSPWSSSSTRIAGRARRRPAGPGREPPGRHQVARRLRDARGHRALPRAPRDRAPGARPQHAALQAVGLRALRAAHLRRAVVLDPAPGAGRLRRLHRAGGHGRGARAALQGPRRSHRPPLAAQPLPPGPGHLRRGHGLRPQRRRRLHPPLRPARARARADARPRAPHGRARRRRRRR